MAERAPDPPARACLLAGQAEIYFSIVQRKVISPNDFTGLDQIRDRLAASEIRCNAIARPFNWKFTRTDLDDLLHRIDAHDKTQPRGLIYTRVPEAVSSRRKPSVRLNPQATAR